MQLREFVGFHSCINSLTFLPLYEAMFLGKWLQTVRQTVRVSFAKGQGSKSISPTEAISTIFLPKVQETIIQ